MKDIADVVDFSLRKIAERGDEQYAHISDLYGCDLETWNRRRGTPLIPFSRQQLVKFLMGRKIEEGAVHAMREDYPGDSEHGRRVAWDPASGRMHELDEKEEPLPGMMVGHIDVDYDNGDVGEVKTTTFFGGKPKTPSNHYVEQLAGYSAALRGVVKRAFIAIVDRISGDIATFWFEGSELTGLQDWARERALEVLEKTDPQNAFPPDPAPRTQWACKFCRYAGCPKNTNAMKNEVSLV